MKNILIIGVVILSIGLLSGCIDSTWTVRGKIAKIEYFVSQVNDDGVTVIYINNNSGMEFKSSSIDKYDVVVGDYVVIEISNIVEPYEVKNMYYSIS